MKSDNDVCKKTISFQDEDFEKFAMDELFLRLKVLDRIELIVRKQGDFKDWNLKRVLNVRKKILHCLKEKGSQLEILEILDAKK